MAAISSTLSLCCTTQIQRSISSSPSFPLSSSNSNFFSNALSVQQRRIHAKTSNKNRGFSCTCLFGLGVPELVVIAGVATLVFGPKKLPEIGRSIGKTFKSFQQAAKEFETELKKEPDTMTEADLEKTAPIRHEERQDKAVTSTKEIL